jgi:hypothetical protein
VRTVGDGSRHRRGLGGDGDQDPRCGVRPVRSP